MELLIIYTIGCFIVGWFGSGTTLGFGSAFLLSILLTPITGFIICLFYPSKQVRDIKIQEHKRQTQILQQMSSPKISHADEIGKLKRQLDEGAITEDEFKILKNKVINS